MRRSLVLLALAVASCSGSHSSGPPATNPLELDLATPTYSVKIGEERRYMCFTTRLPADADSFVTQIEPVYGKATHHLAVYYTLADEPDGEFDCPQLIKTTWIPLYAGGIKSGTLTLPQGAAFHLPKNQQILIQLHLLNSSQADVTDSATIKLSRTSDASSIPAGAFGMSNTQISLAPGVGSAAMDCAAHDPMDVFAVFGHMHQLGTHLALSGPASMLFEENWIFNDQPTVPKTFHLDPGDKLHLDCDYDNTTGQTVTYGESTYNEMCVFLLYYTPYQHLDGCQK